MGSNIIRYDAFVLENAGMRQGSLSTPAVPFTFAGSGSPSTCDVERTKAVPAGQKIRIYDRATDKNFDIFRIVPAGDVDVWVQMGSPSDDSTTKGNLTWFRLELLAANGPFSFTSDHGGTNATPANGASDTADSPTGYTDAGELDARIQAIEIANRGAADTTVRFSKLN